MVHVESLPERLDACYEFTIYLLFVLFQKGEVGSNYPQVGLVSDKIVQASLYPG